MRSIIAVLVSLFFSTVAFAQVNPSVAKVSQPGLNMIFHSGTTITQQNVLNKQQGKETLAGHSCFVVVGPNGQLYQICI